MKYKRKVYKQLCCCNDEILGCTHTRQSYCAQTCLPSIVQVSTACVMCDTYAQASKPSYVSCCLRKKTVCIQEIAVSRNQLIQTLASADYFEDFTNNRAVTAIVVGCALQQLLTRMCQRQPGFNSLALG